MPFILDDKRRSRYLQGIRECPSILSEVAIEAQSRYDAQIELQKLAEYGQNYLPTGWEEGLESVVNSFFLLLAKAFRMN